MPGSEAADTGPAEGGRRDIPANKEEAGLKQQVLEPRTFRAHRAVAREGCLKEEGGVTPGRSVLQRRTNTETGGQGKVTGCGWAPSISKKSRFSTSDSSI